jgi:hypothetical protein
MTDEPLISCVCICRSGFASVKRAIESFREQTYKQKEFVIIDEMLAGCEPEWPLFLVDENVRVFRNLSRSSASAKDLLLANIRGQYVMMWNESDWHHKKRLEIQMGELLLSGKDASALPYFLIYDKFKHQCFLSLPSMCGRTILCKSELAFNNIEDWGVIEYEDRLFMKELVRTTCIYPIIKPYLYICIYSNESNPDGVYFETLVASSYRLSEEVCGILKDALYNCNLPNELVSDVLSNPKLIGQFDYFRYLNMEEEPKDERANALIDAVQDKIVFNGPFKGMKYPELKAIGSTLIPKLVGSYEAELHSIVSAIIDRSYNCVLNIGCGEGYYAVGLALRLTRATIYAYDIDDQARYLCKKMSVLNGVDDRLLIAEECTAEDLGKFNFPSDSIIVCDCEGYEMLLFNRSNLPNLINVDLLIETHDFIDIKISTALIDLFKETHHLKVIKSLDDIEKAKSYCYYPYENVSDLKYRKYIYQEGRPAIMEWLWLAHI